MRQHVRTMSGGEQQMVAIGRAMMSAPEILLLDEPSLGLSPMLTHELFQALAHIRDTGVGVLLVEQNAKESLAIADRGYLIETGRIVGQGEASRLAADPAVREAYLGVAGHASLPVLDHDDTPIPAIATPDLPLEPKSSAANAERRFRPPPRGRGLEDRVPRQTRMSSRRASRRSQNRRTHPCSTPS